MTDWITGIISSLGYTGIGLLMFAENIWPPIPSEIIMPLAGFTAAKGDLNIILVIIAGTVGTVLGTSVWYFLGYFVGKERVETFLDHHGKWLTLSRKDIERADYWFDRHNKRAVFFGRLIPVVRTVISLPAGVSGMRLFPFLVWSTLGSLLWTTFLTLSGYYLYKNWPVVGHYIGYAVPVIVIAAFGYYIFRLYRQLKKEK